MQVLGRLVVLLVRRILALSPSVRLGQCMAWRSAHVPHLPPGARVAAERARASFCCGMFRQAPSAATAAGPHTEPCEPSWAKSGAGMTGRLRRVPGFRGKPRVVQPHGQDGWQLQTP